MTHLNVHILRLVLAKQLENSDKINAKSQMLKVNQRIISFMGHFGRLWLGKHVLFLVSLKYPLISVVHWEKIIHTDYMSGLKNVY